MARGVYEAVKQALNDLIAPQIASVQAEMATLRGDITGLRSEMNANDAALRSEIGAVRTEVHTLDERLTIALDLRERIVALEAKLQG